MLGRARLEGNEGGYQCTRQKCRRPRAPGPKSLALLCGHSLGCGGWVGWGYGERDLATTDVPRQVAIPRLPHCRLATPRRLAPRHRMVHPRGGATRPFPFREWGSRILPPCPLPDLRCPSGHDAPTAEDMAGQQLFWAGATEIGARKRRPPSLWCTNSPPPCPAASEATRGALKSKGCRGSRRTKFGILSQTL